MNNLAPNNLPQGRGPQRDPNSPDAPRFSLGTFIVAALLILGVYWFLGGRIPFIHQEPVGQRIPTSEFVAAVNDNRVVSVTYKTEDSSLTGKYLEHAGDQEPKYFSSTYVGSDSLAELMADHPGIVYVVDPSSFAWVFELLLTGVPSLLLLAALVYMSHKSQAMMSEQMPHVDARRTESERPSVRFSDVAGIDEVVDELRELSDFLSEPERYEAMGARIPRGVLLAGPPGTGKTLIARAVAGEADVPFFSISGSDFVELYVGVGAGRVRDLFRQAREAAPCIVFIDEIDAVGRQRGAGLGGGHDEREQTLNQLLVELDGFEESSSVIVMAATNRPDVLDPALLRPGRFGRRLTVDPPDMRGREAILRTHAKGKKLDEQVDLVRMAQITPGFTGAELADLMNEAALLAARRRVEKIGPAEMAEAMERVTAGPERRSRIMSEAERRIIAYHESGHAVVGKVLQPSKVVHKVSIVSRGRALGYTMQVNEEDRALGLRSEMLADLSVLLGGRTAEELFCDDITTGASNDLERATNVARSMVETYGMSDGIGLQVFENGRHEVFLGRDYTGGRGVSSYTERLIEEEVTRLLNEAHDRTREVLSEHKSVVEALTAALLDHETVDGDELNEILSGVDRYAESE